MPPKTTRKYDLIFSGLLGGMMVFKTPEKKTSRRFFCLGITLRIQVSRKKAGLTSPTFHDILVVSKESWDPMVYE